MSFTAPDPTVYYPVPPGQLPPGFVAPLPGQAVQGIPIVVPVGLQMLISPDGFPVFVPDTNTAPSPMAAHSSPRQQHYQQQQQQQQQPPQMTFAHIETTHRTSSESLKAWTFYSLGLNQTPGEKEIVITLRQDSAGRYTLAQVQPIIYNIYSQIQADNKKGKIYQSGDVVHLTLQTPDRGPIAVGLLLIHSPVECKAQLQDKDVLYGVLGTKDETDVFLKYGATRCLTNMGNEMESWPVPLWSDWHRPSLVKLSDFAGGFLDQVLYLPTRNVVATLDTVSHRLTLVISSTALDLIRTELYKNPPHAEQRLTFLLDLDSGALAYLTWRKGQQGPAVFNAKPNATGFHGCWISLHPSSQLHQQESIVPTEDGLDLKLNGSTWERLYQAMVSKTEAIVPVGAEMVQLVFP